MENYGETKEVRGVQQANSPSIGSYGHYHSFIIFNISGHNAFRSLPACHDKDFLHSLQLTVRQSVQLEVLPADDVNTPWSHWTPAAHYDAASISTEGTPCFNRICTGLHFLFLVANCWVRKVHDSNLPAMEGYGDFVRADSCGQGQN